MGLFDKLTGKNKDNASTEAPAVAPTASGGKLDLGKQSGKISLAKNFQVTIDNGSVITARCTWSSKTDYDLYAIVLMKDGSQHVVSTFGSESQSQPTPSILNGAVKHLGDIGRGAVGVAEETIEIRWNDQIEAIVPVAYSAQSNGTGSFRKYKVSCGISNGSGTEVTIDSKNASMNPMVYTVAIGVIHNTPNGIQIEALEEYAKTGSELRPAFVNGKLVMDKGSRNNHK